MNFDGFYPLTIKTGWQKAVLLWCLLQAGSPSLHYYCAVLLHSCIVLPPVGHSSNHQYHCCQLTDNRVVVRIFIALLRFSFDSPSYIRNITVEADPNVQAVLRFRKIKIQPCDSSCHITNSHSCRFDIQLFYNLTDHHKFCRYISSSNHSTVTVPYQKSMVTSADSLHFQFHPNLYVEVLQVPRFVGLTGSCNCKFYTRNVGLCVHQNLQIQLLVYFANGLAPARHKYVSTERSICVVYTGTSLELALENSPSFRRTVIPHHIATVAENSWDIRHVNYSQ